MTRRVLLLLGVVVAAAAVVLWLLNRDRRTGSAPAATATRERSATSNPPPQSASPTAAPEAPVTRHTTVVVPWEAGPAPEPSPREADETPTPRPEPTATPSVAECVAIRWSSGMSPGNIGEVLVEVRAVNRCGRDLAPLDVWFEVAGYRQGDLVQTARGHPFDPLWRDGEATAMIGLPGSADWYDRIDVTVSGPARP